MVTKWTLVALHIWRALEKAIDEFPPWCRIANLSTWGPIALSAIKRVVAFDVKAVHPVEAEYMHRRFCLASLEASIALPLTFIWLALLSATIRDPRRLWALYGALVALVLCITIDIIIYVSNGDGTFGMVRTCWPYLNIGAAVGAGLSTRYSKIQSRTAAVPEGSSIEDAQTSTATEKGEKKGNEDGPATSAKTQELTLPPIVHIVGMIALSIVFAAIGTNSAIPRWATPAAEYDTAKRIELWILLLGEGACGFCYGLLACQWITNTTHLVREISFGASLAAVSLAVLRLTTPFTSWPSWAIDALLVFVLFNVGVFAGNTSCARATVEKPILGSNEKQTSSN